MSQQEGSHVISFSANVEQELVRLNAEMRITGIIQSLAKGKTLTLQEEEANEIRAMLLVLTDLFSTSLPPVDSNPVDTLKAASRDIKLSTLLRERGLARMYLLTYVQMQQYDPLTRQNVLVPAYMTMTNPDTGRTFSSQEEYLGLFCRESKVPRSLVFQRMRTYDRLLELGMTLEEAFDVILQKPFAARKTLNTLGSWSGGELVGMDPEIALRLTQLHLPAQVEQVEDLIDIINTSEDEQDRTEAQEDLLETVKPALRKMVEEVAHHDSVRDAMDTVIYDVAGVPEIGYWYDRERGWIKIEYLEKARDPHGTLYVKKEHVFYLVPEQDLPTEVLEDLRARLSLKNRILDL